MKITPPHDSYLYRNNASAEIPASNKEKDDQAKAKDLFDAVFTPQTWSICRSHYDAEWDLKNTEDDLSCIIADPTYNLNHPMIDFDVEGACKVIYEAALLKVNRRTKSLCAVVRGQGGGKSRQLIESWVCLCNPGNAVGRPHDFEISGNDTH